MTGYEACRKPRPRAPARRVMNRGAARFASLLGLAGLLCAAPGCSALVKTEQCQTTADCAPAGFPQSVCSSDKFCVPLISPECPQVLGGPVTDRTVVIGHLTVLSGVNDSFGKASVPAATLALDELTTFGRGIPSPAPTTPRSLAIVVCDHAAATKAPPGDTTTAADRAALHLMRDLKVPLVIGPVFSALSIDMAERYFIPSGVLMINPFSVVSDLTDPKRADNKGLIYRTALSDRFEPAAMAQLVIQLEKDVRARLPSGERTRVAAVAKGDLYGRGLAVGSETVLTINGALAVNPDNAKSYKLVQFADLTKNPTYDTKAAIQGVLDLRPHIVLVYGTGEMIKLAVQAIEDGWPIGQAPPLYVLSEGLKLIDLLTLGGDYPTLGKRIRLTAPMANQNLSQGFTERWRAAYATVPPDVYGTAGTYDAVYLSAYSIAALRGRAPTGANLADGLRRTVPPGVMRISAGPGQSMGQSQILSAYAALSQGQSIDYDGVAGTLDFDQYGDGVGDYDILCMGGSPPVFKSTGQRYETASNSLVPAMASSLCP